MNFFTVLVLILILDLIWINGFFKYRFFPMIENIQKSPVVVEPIYFIAAYLILTTLIYVMIPKCTSYGEAFLIGFLIYAVYDSTNLATIKGWNVTNAIMDSLWGGFLMLIIYSISKIK